MKRRADLKTTNSVVRGASIRVGGVRTAAHTSCGVAGPLRGVTPRRSPAPSGAGPKDPGRPSPSGTRCLLRDGDSTVRQCEAMDPSSIHRRLRMSCSPTSSCSATMPRCVGRRYFPFAATSGLRRRCRDRDLIRLVPSTGVLAPVPVEPRFTSVVSGPMRRRTNYATSKTKQVDHGVLVRHHVAKPNL